MKEKVIWFVIVLILFVSIYKVFFQTKTVSYIGEDKNWHIQINAKLLGLNGSYKIKVQYKGKESIEKMNFNVHPQYHVRPLFDGAFLSLNEDGYYQYECKEDCGFYDKESKLLFFIIWKEKQHSEENMNFIELIKK